MEITVTYDDKNNYFVPFEHIGKLASALNYLGERYCFHPANRVKRLDVPLPDNTVDVTKTWRRFQ